MQRLSASGLTTKFKVRLQLANRRGMQGRLVGLGRQPRRSPKGEGGSSPELLGQAAIAPAAPAGAARGEPQAQSAITGEARARHASAVGAP